MTATTHWIKLWNGKPERVIVVTPCQEGVRMIFDTTVSFADWMENHPNRQKLSERLAKL